jgi:DNA-binding CsgD family transcriptional regulator
METLEVSLTEKQERVLRWIGTGRTYAQIADQLGMKERTVKAYSDTLRKKFSTRGVPVATGRALIPIAHEYFAADG